MPSRTAKALAIPDTVIDEDAAALPSQGLTAHYLATASYRIVPGDTVLIHAGAGGVGLLLTQLAKTLGATVSTTVSSATKAAASRDAGADHVLGYDGFAADVRHLTMAPVPTRSTTESGRRAAVTRRHNGGTTARPDGDTAVDDEHGATPSRPDGRVFE